MATGETGFEDIAYDLVSVQYHALKAGHDYGQYVRDAENAGKKDMADFFRAVMAQNSEWAAQCHQHLANLTTSKEMGPAAT
jgi:rubrerythrin